MKEKERLEQYKSQMEQVLNGKITPLLELLGRYIGDGNPKVP